jgi:hypothetical protein
MPACNESPDDLIVRKAQQEARALIEFGPDHTASSKPGGVVAGDRAPGIRTAFRVATDHDPPSPSGVMLGLWTGALSAAEIGLLN